MAGPTSTLAVAASFAAGCILLFTLSIIQVARHKKYWPWVLAASVWSVAGTPVVMIVGSADAQSLSLAGGVALLGICFLLSVVFVVQVRRLKRDVGYLALWAISMVFWIILTALGTMPGQSSAFNVLRTSVITIGFFFVALFLEELFHAQPRLPLFLLFGGLFSVVNIFAWLEFYFAAIDPMLSVLLSQMVTIAQQLYNIAICGFMAKVFVRTYRKTREYQPGLLTFAATCGLIGSFLQAIAELLSDSSGILAIDGAMFWGIALVLTLFTFLGDLDYIYRLPDNYYLLLVAYKDSGLPVHSVRFQSSKDVTVDENLLSGFLTAVNTLFGESLRSGSRIERISSGDASLLMYTGHWVTATIAGDTAPAILKRALRRYTRAFEARYADALQAQTPALGTFNDANDLIPQAFPFL
jgi:hypothetical protein